MSFMPMPVLSILQVCHWALRPLTCITWLQPLQVGLPPSFLLHALPTRVPHNLNNTWKGFQVDHGGIRKALGQQVVHSGFITIPLSNGSVFTVSGVVSISRDRSHGGAIKVVPSFTGVDGLLEVNQEDCPVESIGFKAGDIWYGIGKGIRARGSSHSTRGHNL
jgi:hypothetical protein